MTDLLLELIPDGDSLLDYGISPNTNYTCRFCGESFNADADTSELRSHYRFSGCGCVPEVVIDFAEEIKKPITGFSITSETVYGGKIYTIRIGSRVKKYDPWNGYDWDCDGWIERNTD